MDYLIIAEGKVFGLSSEVILTLDELRVCVQEAAKMPVKLLKIDDESSDALIASSYLPRKLRTSALLLHA